MISRRPLRSWAEEQFDIVMRRVDAVMHENGLKHRRRFARTHGKIMMLLDVNILVEAHREDAPRHQEIRPWLESRLTKPPGIALSDLVLSGFVRVVTHPKVFILPTPLADALEF